MENDVAKDKEKKRGERKNKKKKNQLISLGKSGKDFLKQCVAIDPDQRPSVKTLLKHKWIKKGKE